MKFSSETITELSSDYFETLSRDIARRYATMEIDEISKSCDDIRATVLKFREDMATITHEQALTLIRRTNAGAIHITHRLDVYEHALLVLGLALESERI